MPENPSRKAKVALVSFEANEGIPNSASSNVSRGPHSASYNN